MIPGGKLFHPVGGLENSFSEHFDSRTLLHYLHSSIHLSFIHIYHFDMLSLAVWQDTCYTYKNLVHDLTHYESPIAQWLERSTGILEGHGFYSRWGLDLRTLLRYLHFIQVTNLFTIYFTRVPNPVSNQLCVRKCRYSTERLELVC